MAVITFTTDFGLKDEYAGVMKGAVLSANPHVQLVDISHHIPSFDIMEAARMLEASYPYFPAGSVHVVVVDPGVGSSRSIVAFEMEGHRFLVPDNGIAAYLIREKTVDALVRLEKAGPVKGAYSETFHGRDVFAPTAARMAEGRPLSELGPSMAPSGLVSAKVTLHVMNPDGSVQADIAKIDIFGNVITDLHVDTLGRWIGSEFHGRLEARLGRGRVRGLYHHYGEVALFSPLMVVGSRGFLEIAVNQGSAKEHFGVEPGDHVMFLLWEGNP